jgi:hypothetical protein
MTTDSLNNQKSELDAVYISLKIFIQQSAIYQLASNFITRQCLVLVMLANK